MRNVRRMMALIASVAALSTGALVLTSHAADQPTSPAAAQPAPGTAPASSAGHTATNTPVKPGAPQVPEESATIRDDPTIAPDPKQSADNSVSFPNDI
jgi:hypothetical protein